MKKSLHDYQNREGFFGGQGGIRTHEPLARLPDFESFSQLVKNWSFRVSFRSFRLRRKPHKIRLFHPWGLIRLHFFKVGSNRHFCRFWREIRGDRREITREGNTKFNTP